MDYIGGTPHQFLDSPWQSKSATFSLCPFKYPLIIENAIHLDLSIKNHLNRNWLLQLVHGHRQKNACHEENTARQISGDPEGRRWPRTSSLSWAWGIARGHGAAPMLSPLRHVCPVKAILVTKILKQGLPLHLTASLVIKTLIKMWTTNLRVKHLGPCSLLLLSICLVVMF